MELDITPYYEGIELTYEVTVTSGDVDRFLRGESVEIERANMRLVDSRPLTGDDDDWDVQP